jgi:hypothetical protein
MSTGALDPLIHDPQRLRIVAALAALPDGDALTVTRLQDMIGLPPGSPICRLRELGTAGYVRTEITGSRSQAAQDLPDLTLFLAQVSFPRRKRARPGHKTGKPPGHRPWQHHHG